jgi:hypothetical protein
MAKIHVETAVIKLSTLTKDNEVTREAGSLLDQELLDELVKLIEQHLGPTVLVELEQR